MQQNRKVVVFIACSLDGYIATKDESLEWLFQVEGEGDNGFSAFYDTVDTVVMGKKTYDWVMNQEMEAFPYEGKECVVFSRSSWEDTEHVRYRSGDVLSFIEEQKSRKGKDIWVVGGGELLDAFIQEGLVDEFIITVAPVILGNGIPLFREGDRSLNLTLKGTQSFNQFVELHYEVKR
ncbi:dihydrofolate reductase family protein [Rossellomorea marisflavi]|uniref:dihydrofolate reductase family protein n=1 Tax=Rossellomorea marisflavi TaxID=189381 RepID=UPI00204125C5|nr:dihydrofolate reductase family protein [Rossellomorea marisflavi]MCM2587948.1 dihydrofolate reductase family protein [Rossellomorea marisflavi]